MEKSVCGLLKYFILASMLICFQSVYARNQNSDFLSNSKRVRIIIEQSYENCGVEEINLPIKDITVKILKYAAIDTIRSGTEDYDTTIKIIIEGKADGTYYYPAGYLYTGAYLSGKITIEAKTIPVCEKKYEVYINTPSSIGITWNPNRPCDAPFDRAFYLSGSVVSKILEIIYESYGIDPLISALEDKNTDFQRMVIDSLVNIGKPATVSLIAAIYGGDLDVRRGCIEALGELGDKSAVEDLIFLLKAEDSITRWKAAKALGKLGDERAVEPLIAVLNDENRIARWYAAKSLGDIGDIRAVEPLTAILKDSDPGVQSYARESLKKINIKNSNKLITEINERDRYQW